MNPFTILVPSRKRAHHMPQLLALLPSALITVDEREADDYAAVVPKKQLLIHPALEDGLWAVLNWAQEEIKTDCLVEIDDEFKGVRCLVGSHRLIRNSEDILAIIENAHQAAVDLGASAFCFSRAANYLLLKPDLQPIRPVQPVCCAFGMLGPARHRKYDGTFLGRGDVDWTLRTLMEDRFVYADCRFYFDVGRIFSGRGGNVGIVTAERFAETNRALKKKWGDYIVFTEPNFAKRFKKRSVAAMKINVSRFNPTAQT